MMRFISIFLLLLMTAKSYGTWESPVTAEMVAAGSKRIGNMLCDGSDSYFSELRPANQGRYTLVRIDAKGQKKDMTPADFNVRTFVHEYGGGAFTVSNGVIYAANAADGCLYRIVEGKKPEKITDGSVRFADFHVTKKGLLAVAESHTGKNVENFIALIDIKTGSYKKLVFGSDFYSSPAISQDGKKIAWISWNHPNMPWTQSELWFADWKEDSSLANMKKVSGTTPEAFFEPSWSYDNVLYFVTDRDSGWWNLHRYVKGRIENVCPMPAESAEPMWIFGQSTYAFLGKDKIALTYNREGIWHLGILDIATGHLKDISRKSTVLQQLRSGKKCVRFLEEFPDQLDAIVEMDSEGICKVISQEKITLDSRYISIPQHITFSSGSHFAHGFYYAPKNPNEKATSDEKPPLVVMIHGGPTAQAQATFEMEKQFWTTRGFAVLDVNYGGSTGYGREFRSLLDGAWGIVDVDDCVNGALYLSEQSLVDRNKLVIRGGSAGGYTTLAALAFKDVFKAGASYYGIADLTLLAQDTHKFESRYLEPLIGKYPEEKKLWEDRSPINSVNNISAPLILFQGEEDMIVPMNQSVLIFEALKKRGVPVELHLYPGEQHGFRMAKNIADSLNRELEFYLKVL